MSLHGGFAFASQCDNAWVEHRYVEKLDSELPKPLAGSVKDIDTGSSVRVPGAVRVSSQDTVGAGQIAAAEGCGGLDYTRVWTSVQGACLWKHKVVNMTKTKEIHLQITLEFYSVPKDEPLIIYKSTNNLKKI